MTAGVCRTPRSLMQSVRRQDQTMRGPGPDGPEGANTWLAAGKVT
jgi:hypothetical protein